ncbi:MAG: DegV family protein, partial [Oscillospiraceae bacterium]|nr:DegV family protein [Oscillospiraceae bacterium]
QELLKKYDITLAPLTVVKGDDQFKDGVTITPADVFAHVAAGGALCSTAAVSIGEYADLFRTYSNDYDGIIHINIGSDFSACHQNALLAAEDFPNVRCVDSRNLTTGQGFVVLKACQLAKEMDDLDAIVEKLNAYTEKIEASFLVDKLDYLVKGGRCSSVAALGANLLNLKPCIEVKDGKMTVVKKYRGNFAKSLAAYVRERLSNRDDIDYDTIFITKAVIGEECETAVKEAIAECSQFANIYETATSCTVSCHCGPDTLGIIFVRK